MCLVSLADWGVDTDPLVEALNLCYRCDHGKRAVAIAEEQFNALAAGTYVGAAAKL